MSDESALLAAILAHPDEDTPRLMYADWLQENGQPERAEFIRIQCDSTADEAAEARAAELEERHRGRWLAGLGAPQFPGARWEFRRGFSEYLDVPIELMLERYESFARVPWLRFLSLRDLSYSDVRDFANRPWNPRLIELEIQDDLSPTNYGYDTTPFISALANCSQASQLRRLQLSLLDFTPEGIDLLATSSHLENLQQLHLAGDRDDPRFAPLRKRFGERLVIG